jgi:hypothetical protein
MILSNAIDAGLGACCPQIFATVVRTASRRPWLETVLVMKTAENQSGHDVAALRESDGPSTPARCQGHQECPVPSSRVDARDYMSDPLPKDAAEVTLV